MLRIEGGQKVVGSHNGQSIKDKCQWSTVKGIVKLRYYIINVQVYYQSRTKGEWQGYVWSGDFSNGGLVNQSINQSINKTISQQSKVNVNT